MVLFIFRFLSLPTWIAMLVMPLLIAPATAQTTPSNTDTTLSVLTLAPGNLLSTFASDKTTYAFAVQSGATEITVTATPTNSGATVTITPADASATSGHQVNVSTLPVSIRIVVSPAMGTTTLTYTVSAGNFTDYDTDGDNLIELGAGQTGLAQLNAMRWDLNGNGFIDASATTSDTTAYNAAFSNRPPGMGCETTCIGYELLNNLDFDENSDNEITSADATYWNSGAGWAPIGSSATKYTGTFHGNDYTISNLFIDRSAASKTGLFGYAEGNTIRNLSLVNANVTGNAETAVLVGEGNNLQLMHIRVTGQVSGFARSGGLVGRLAHGNSTITACRSEVDVTGSNLSTGGLVGWSDGTIIASYATGAVSGNAYVGGLVGFHGNTGNPKAVIRASYATGVVRGNNTTGGLVGANFYSSTITGSYAIGPVSANSHVGGLVGTNNNSSITHSYYDRTTTRRSDTGRGAPQTTAALQGPTGYTGIYMTNWDLNLDGQPGGDDPWTFGKTDQYPVLKYAGMDTTVQYNLQPPSIPTSVTMTIIADTLDVRWRGVSGATGYKVQWKSGTQSYDTDSREATTTGTRHKIPNLTFGTTYTVRVIATKTGVRDGTPSEQSIFIASTLDNPTVMASAKVDTLTVTWNAVDHATGYKVQWKSGSATYPNADLALATRGQATIAGGSTTTYKISNVTAGTTYTIRVIATNTNVNIPDSDPSEEVMVTAATNKPTNVRVTPGHLQLLVRWTEATGATGYKIQWKSGQQAYNTSSRQETVSMGSTTTYTIENLTFGTTYTMRVTATLSGGADSTPSDEVMGTPQGIDYDGDGNGLIDIETLAQLNAIRWDLNGDGAIDASASTSDTTAYNAAFPNRDITSNVRMGCPSGTCTGYELLNNLNFDENGDGEITSADATYWNNGDGWLPIGTNAARYTGDFKGNGYTIDNLTINRPAVVEVGLFGNADTASRIESVGVTNASVAGGEYAAALVGALRGTVVACYSTGSVSATTRTAGGLVGWTPNAITSSYSTASVSGPEHVGGLLGASQGGTVTNSYSIGMVTGTGSSPLIGGLIGSGTGGTASYWDTQTSGCTSGGSNGCTTSAGGSGVTGQTTSALQSPTGYTLIFSTWNANLDGQPGNDEPWTFGKTDQYPVLKYAGMDTTVQYNLQPPGIPTSVTVTPKVDTLDVRWRASSYATGYKVQWKSGMQSYAASREGIVTGTRYKIPNLLGETTYTVRVIATKTGANDSTPSAEQTGVLALLGSPTVMVASKVDTLTVTWNAVNGATGYKVQWKSGATTYPTSDSQAATHGQATISDGRTTTYKISGLTAGTTYTIRVIATSTNINLADSAPSEEVMVTSATTKPTNVRVTPGPVQLIVRWTEATGATGYKVQWRSGQQTYNTSDRQETVSGMSTTTYTIENLTFGTTYTVRVTATLSGGGDSTPSDEVMGTPQGIDYDGDGNGLIDIKTLAQLNAIRWDLNGDGIVADSDITNYNAAFPNRDTTSNVRMGCPSGTCTGYELLNNLNFDTDGSGSVTSADTYPNWSPIGGTYSTTFKGNNKTISNLHINRGQDDVGLFGRVSGNISGLGLKSVNVRGRNQVGGLVGNQVGGRILGCYVTGRVEGTGHDVGGLAGESNGNNTVIAASYANAEVSGGWDHDGAGGLVGRLKATVIASYAIGPVTGNNRVGGLVGRLDIYPSSVSTSYATGTVTGRRHDSSQLGGLIGFARSGVSHSYWDSESSGRSSSSGGTSQTTSALRSETDYNGIYANWNVDVDGRPGNDAPWTFGAADQYPVLKYAGMDTTAQFAMQPPGIPTSVTVTVQRDTLDVRWRAPSNATGYKVQWKSGAQNYAVSRQAITTDTRYKIANLIGGTTYTVRIIATKTGDGRPSAEQTGVPLLGSPTGVEVNAKVDTLTVTWNAVNGVTGYKVQWKSGSETYPAADEESATHGQATIAGGGTTTHDISGLTPGTTYAIRVIATRTNVADSAPSEEVITLLTLGSPTGVEVSAKVDTLTVTWNAVPLATGYKVQWKSGSETYPTSDLALATRGQATIAGGNTTIHKISGLTTETTYAIRVIATHTTTAGNSAPSEEVMVTLATTRPTNVRVTPGPDQLIVRWTEATGATGYKVQWRSGQQTYNTSSRQETVSGGSTTTYTIENLTFGTTYTVRVTATLAGGTDSTPSDEVMGMPQRINYDSDGDGLIDIKTLAQLHAIRWDLNGDGVVADNDTMTYNAAFPNRDTTSNGRMGCPSGTCTGYELLNNLDFDENGDDQITQADATYWNRGAGWIPIGTYTGTFKGNNKTISNLYISYRYPSQRNNVGLFSTVSGDISGVGLLNVNVHATDVVGGLVGAQNGGRITGCYVTGFVEGARYGVGGLVGRSLAGHIAACYSHATAQKWPSWESSVLYEVGGLVGLLGSGASVTASYATGPVAGQGGSNTRSAAGGLVGQNAGTITASYATGTATGDSNDLTGGLFATGSGTGPDSYWDTESSSLSSSAGGTGKTTSALRSETDYNGIYTNWNVDVDGRPGNDDPWTFGAADQYPVLKYAGMDTTAQFAMQPPGIPTSVTVTPKADTLDVRWRAPSNATGYKVQWKSGAQNYDASREETVTGTRYKIANLLTGTTYTVRVIATKTGVRDGMPSAEQTGVPVLGIPTVMVAAKVDTLTVTWNAVNGATGYKVQWKSGSETYPAADEQSATHGQATISDGGTTTYEISGLTAGTTYAIRVIATRTNVADSTPSEEVTGVPVLGSPTVMVAAKVDTLTVTWNVVDDATGYKVQWKSGSETYPTSDLALATRGQATIAGGGTTTYKISGLTTGTTYTIRVIATRTNVADSAPSEEVMVTLATTRPTNVRVTPGPVQLIVAWTEATGATGYKVQWRSGQQTYNTSDRQATVSGMSTTTYTIENLTFGTTYTVRVLATLAGGTDSDPSDEVMGMPQTINYDSDGDGLIDIKTLAQLHAIRWDLNGDGVVADNDTMNYNAAFPNRDTTSNVRMGCPSGTCTGYELLNNLDFDESGDDQITQADATYWNSGAGWIPIGTYTGTFKGNNKTISNLYISYRWPSQRNNVGLFSTVSGDISGVGLLNVNVHATDVVGGLVGTQNGGRITGCYVTGFVEGARYGVGGLVGRSLAGHIAACYSHATAQKWPSWESSVLYEVGGLVGLLGSGASVTASYATGPVAGQGGSNTRSAAGGLVGQNAGTITASYATGTATGDSNDLTGGLFATGSGTGPDSYWDTESSSLSTSAGGTGKTTSALQSETDYNDIYANWNVDVDGRPGNDDPWTFGAADQYPVLKYAGMDTTVQYNLQPPGIPTSVTVTVQRDTLDVRWRAASYATGYKVQWKSGDQNYDASREETVTGTRYKIANLLAGTTYTVRVIATKTGAPDGRPSAEQTGVSVLGSPTVMVAAKADTLTVTWNAVTNATGYKVQWKSGSETYPAADEQSATHGQATISGGSTTIHKISGLTAGTTYTIRVIATRTNVADSAPSEEVTGVPLLGSPTVMVAAKVDTLTVTWNAVTNATGYKVQWKSGSETYPAADEQSATHGQATIAGGSTTTYKISGLTAETTYAIRVIATRTNVADSAPSEEVMVTLATTRPTNVRVTPGPVQLVVAWTEATGATGYKVQWKSGGQSYNTSSRQETVSGGSTTTYTIENLTIGTPYTVRVLATLAGGTDSTPSDEVMGTPYAINYDSDGDGLIDIETLAQLHAIRWDLNGDGVVADNDTMTYNAAFPDRDITSNGRMGCPSGTCTGYELLNNLDFDENGDDQITQADATYWNNGDGWLPIGTDAARYTGDFKGNGYTIDNLTINRPSLTEVGLFGNADTASRIESVGVINASVAGGEYAAALVGALRGTVVACYSTGNVSATTRVAGGLVGWTPNAITSSYSTASVSGPEHVGGLLGASQGGTVTNSYSTGVVTRSSGTLTTIGGLIGSGTGGTASYWDTQTSGCTSGGSNGCTTSAGGGGVTGQTTSALQSPTGYTLIFSTWNANLDGQPGGDDPWTFGATNQYPVLKYAGMDTTVQFQLQPAIPSANLDIDGNGRVDLFTDIIMIIRYALSFREESLTYRALSVGATRTTHLDITAYINTLYEQKILDVDRDGEVDLFTDIIMIIRYALSFREESLTYRALSVNAMRTTHQDITAYIESLYPDSHFQ